MKPIKHGSRERVRLPGGMEQQQAQRRLYVWMLSLNAAAFFAMSVWFGSQPETAMTASLVGWLSVGGAVRVARKGADDGTE